MHKDFQFVNIERAIVVREIKVNLSNNLLEQKEEAAQTQYDLTSEREALQAELTCHEDFAAILAIVSETNVEARGLVDWMAQTNEHFYEAPLPSVLNELLDDLDLSDEYWWRELFQTNRLLMKSLELQSRIRRKAQVSKSIVNRTRSQ